MVEPEKAVKFISKLVQLTQDKKVAWEVASSAPRDADSAFIANVEGRTLKIYRYSREIPNPDYEAYVSRQSTFALTISSATLFGSKEPPEPPKTVLRSGTNLEVLDGNILAYRFSNKAGLSDLYESASYSAAKVDDLMDAVLKKK